MLPRATENVVARGPLIPHPCSRSSIKFTACTL